jgi:hypothetical protein
MYTIPFKVKLLKMPEDHIIRLGELGVMYHRGEDWKTGTVTLSQMDFESDLSGEWTVVGINVDTYFVVQPGRTGRFYPRDLCEVTEI